MTLRRLAGALAAVAVMSAGATLVWGSVLLAMFPHLGDGAWMVAMGPGVISGMLIYGGVALLVPKEPKGR